MTLFVSISYRRSVCACATLSMFFTCFLFKVYLFVTLYMCSVTLLAWCASCIVFE